MLSALIYHFSFDRKGSNMPSGHFIRPVLTIALTPCQWLLKGFEHVNTFYLHYSLRQVHSYKHRCVDEDSECLWFVHCFGVERNDGNFSNSLCEDPHSSCCNGVGCFSQDSCPYSVLWHFRLSSFFSPMTVKGRMLTRLGLPQTFELSSHPFCSFTLLFGMLGKSHNLTLWFIKSCVRYIQLALSSHLFNVISVYIFYWDITDI